MLIVSQPGSVFRSDEVCISWLLLHAAKGFGAMTIQWMAGFLVVIGGVHCSLNRFRRASVAMRRYIHGVAKIVAECLSFIKNC